MDAAAWQVNGPVLVIMLGPTLAVLLVALVSGASIRGTVPVAGMVLIVSWLFAWLTWSILTPRWRLWAYERVEDIDELKRIAVADRVLWRDGHIFHRTELAPPVLMAKLQMIEAERRAAAEARARPIAEAPPAKPAPSKTTAKPRKPKTPAS